MITDEARHTVRGSGLLLAQRGGYIVGGFLFTALVPRLMGPVTYGEYSLLTSLAVWFSLFSALGLTQILSRHVPQYALRGDREGLLRLFGSLVAVQAAGGLAAGALYALLTLLWLRELDPWALIAVAGMIAARAFGQVFYALSLGLNRAPRWGVAELLRRWASLGLLVVGFYLGGMRGACLGLVLTELLIGMIGLWWSRPYLSRWVLRPDLRHLLPYLRFGFLFFVSDLLAAAFQSSGSALVRAISGDYAGVAFFGLAYNMYLAVALAIPQFSLAFAPLLSSLLARGDLAALRAWSERLLKWLAVGAMVLVLGALFLAGNVAPVLLGRAYRPVAAELVLLALALVAQALTSVASLLALTYGRARLAVAASAIRLASFWALGVPLIAWRGGLGASAAVVVATAIAAAYYTVRARALVRYSLQPAALAIGLGALFAPLAWLRSSWVANVALCGVSIAGYTGLLFLLRVVTPRELAAAWQAFRGRPAGAGATALAPTV